MRIRTGDMRAIPSASGQYWAGSPRFPRCAQWSRSAADAAVRTPNLVEHIFYINVYALHYPILKSYVLQRVEIPVKLL